MMPVIAWACNFPAYLHLGLHFRSVELNSKLLGVNGCRRRSASDQRNNAKPRHSRRVQHGQIISTIRWYYI